MANKKHKAAGKAFDPSKFPVAHTVSNETVADFADAAMKTYGQKTLEDRTVPDMYDGLKPVQRRVLQAFIDLGGRHNKPFTKTARYVGHALGVYHPHGDSACADSIDEMVNCATPLAEGSGNWGNLLTGDSPAAMRYTEVRISRYAEMVFFHPKYWAVATKVPNYDGKDMEAFMLPARLPNALINGAFGIATAITTHTPSFTVESVLNVLDVAVLKYKSGGVDNKDCRKLEFNMPAQYGGEMYLDGDWKDDWRNLIKTGQGSVLSVPITEIDKAAGTVRIKGYGDEVKIEKPFVKMAEQPWFKGFTDLSGALSGKKLAKVSSDRTPAEFDIHIKLGKGETFSSVNDEIVDLFSKKHDYKLNLTRRMLGKKNEETISIERFNIPGLLNQWLKRRVDLEAVALTRLIEQNRNEARLTEVRIIASANLDKIFKVLKSGLDFDGMRKRIAKELKVSSDEAEYILRMQVYRLSKLDGDTERKGLKALKEEGASLAALLKNPIKAVAADLRQLRKELV